jgi:predicted phage terminase large subunit-like protein
MKNEPSSTLSSARGFDLPSNLEEALRASIREDEQREQRDTLNRDAEAIRRKCKSLYQFVQAAWPIVEPGTTFVGGWAIEAICDHLEAVSRGEIKRLLINVPPRMSKSTMVAVFWPAWEWGPLNKPHLHYLTTSFSGPNIIRDTGKMRLLVESEWFQRLWGDQVQPTDKWGEKLIINSARGQREGRPFSKLTGGGGDRLIFDDPHDTEAAESSVQRNRVVKTFREGLSDRLRDPNNSVIVGVMQRLHESDVSGEILRLRLPYVHLNLPMEFEATRKEGNRLVSARCRTYIDGELFFEDPRQNEGDLLFPERFSRATVEATKIVKGAYAWAGQYQQRPAPRDGGLFKREWFEGDGSEGSSRIITDGKIPACTRWVRGWDFAATAKTAGTDPDNTASCLMGRTRDGRYIIAHAGQFQEGPAQTERNVKALAENDGKGVTIRIPEDPAAGGKYLVRDMIRLLAGWVVRVVRVAGSKEARAGPLATQAEHGNVYLVAGNWVAEWLDTVCNFPNARYDDLVDASADAFNELSPAAKDSRHAGAGNDRKMTGLIEETQDAELARRIHATNRSAISAPGRARGIL